MRSIKAFERAPPAPGAHSVGFAERVRSAGSAIPGIAEPGRLLGRQWQLGRIGRGCRIYCPAIRSVGPVKTPASP